MENKYKERAKELFHEHSKMVPILGSIEEYCDIDQAVKAMCQLVKEVEISTKKVYVDFITAMTNGTLFTKERVEELLQKQRELCAEQTLTNREDILNAKLKID